MEKKKTVPPKKYRILLITFLIVVFLALLGVVFKEKLIVATVNGQPIWRITLIKELEERFGKQTLDTLITKTLIHQEAKRQNITVTSEEVDGEIEKIKKNLSDQGQDLNQILSLQGMNQDDLKKQIRLQKTLEKILKDQIKVSDEEIASYIAKNKESIPEGMSQEEVKKRAKENIYQQKLNNKIQEWIKNARQKAKINYFVQW